MGHIEAQATISPNQLYGNIFFIATHDKTRDICVVQANGDNPHCLTKGLDVYQYSVTSDGQRIAYNLLSDGNIYTMDANGEHQTNLTNSIARSQNIAWSPDGKHIAFDYNRDHPKTFDIFIMDADGKNVVNLTGSGGSVHPVWSHDGKQIGFSSAQDASTYACIINADGSQKKCLPHEQGIYQSFSSWSPTDKQIAYISQGKNSKVLNISAVDGSDQYSIAEDIPTSAVIWSPEGNQVILTSQQGLNVDIYIADADGANLLRLPVDSARYTTPMWSPDGNYIAVTRSVEAQSTIDIIDVKTAKQYTLIGEDFLNSQGATSAINPVWVHG
jgi:TolB protein